MSVSAMRPARFRLALSYGAALALGKPLSRLFLVLMLAFGGRAEAGEPLRLVAIGDSLTAGYGLAQGDGFVPQLDAWLAKQGLPEVEVVNMGVSGDTTAGGAARLDWALADGADAVMVALGGNDLLRGIQPETTRANLESMLSRLGERGLPVLLVGMQAPLNYGPEYKEAFDAVYPDLAAAYDALLYPFFLEGLFGKKGLFQDDGIHPNKAGVAQMVDGIGPQVLSLVGQVGG
ncbi:MAG: arylesterase [Pseudomonadota bacterium]